MRAVESYCKPNATVCACGYLVKEKSKTDTRGAARARLISGKRWIRGYTPAPNPLKRLTGAGFAKMACKILSRKDLEAKILKTNDLLHSWRFLCAQPLLPMICSLNL